MEILSIAESILIFWQLKLETNSVMAYPNIVSRKYHDFLEHMLYNTNKCSRDGGRHYVNVNQC